MKTFGFSQAAGLSARHVFFSAAALVSLLCTPSALAQIQVWIPPQTTQIFHPGTSTTVWVPPVYQTVQVPETTQINHIPATTIIVHHPAVTTLVHHDAVTTYVHHDAVTHTVHHDIEIGVTHYDEVSHVEHHDASTHTVYVDGYWDSAWVDGYYDDEAYWVDGYYDYDNSSEGNWVEGYWEGGGWVDGYWDDFWVDGYDYEETETAAWDETVVDVPEHDDYYLISPAYNEEVVDVEAFDEPVTTPAFDEPVTTPAYDEPVVIPEHDDIVVVPAHTETVLVSEGHNETVTTQRWWETIIIVPGHWVTVIQAAATKMVVDGDIATLTWNNATAEPLTTPIYSGDDNGDMVAWKITGITSPSACTFTWTAEGPESIVGPSGTGIDEWKIATDDADAEHDRLTWQPGTYTILCQINGPNNLNTEVRYQQAVGWRTDRLLVVGQVRPISDFSLSASQKSTLKSALVDDIKSLGPLKYLTWVSYISDQIDNLAASASVELIAPVWFGFNALPPKRFAPLPSVGNDERFWLVQTILNANGDTVTLSPTLTNVEKIELLDTQSYRMLSEYQVKYLVDTTGKMVAETVVATGSVTSPTGTAKISLKGPTKLGVPSWVLTVLDPLGVPNNGTQIVVSAIANSNNGTERVDRVGDRISLYTSGRVGYEGSYPNYALFERDVPYIFNEIIFGLDGQGRDRNNHARLSVNTRWNQTMANTGFVYFNEIRVYRRDNASSEYQQEALFSIGGGAGMLQPFINSVPWQQFETYWGTTIPNPHANEPAPQVPNTL